MDPESQKLLAETYALAKENNNMLHGIRRSQRMASFMRAIYWLIIIGASVWSFYALQPYLTKVLGVYNSVSGSDLLKNFGN